MRRLRDNSMRYDRHSIRSGLQHIANEAPNSIEDWRGQRFRESALEAMAYIIHLEGELRRQGFTDYTDKEENNG